MNAEEWAFLIDERYGYKEGFNSSWNFNQQESDIDEIKEILLKRSYQFNEDTDPDTDVSFGLIIESKFRYWIIRLSMVGKFAAFFRFDANSAFEKVITGPELEDSLEKMIVDFLEMKQYHILNRAELALPLKLKLAGFDQGDVCIYQALFVQDFSFPWD